ncbi:hypothetical protein K3N28_14020 [Glycomyces sp. TRM65418]|uniref:hypothetical protein n=1 Tax=Glycomyces sp. TRM65418 TaxID=2867006 RepID=UPI001CE681C5|nr:hypothetical protein [Glycomyces sp. TRM65418]MCC3764181.1 hypothetical protein [Glycomyces sp. TRM65418]QZD53865.1 hypothetical protein K3N28_13955 [Glycomyces sp. TRM65418]
MDRGQIASKVERVRDAIPAAREALWSLPPGRGVSSTLSPIAALYEVTHAPRCGSLVFWTAERIEAGRAEVADDFEEWEFDEPEPNRWAPVARCENATVYLHSESGAVAVTSADEIKAGSRRLRRLAPGLFEFFDRFALGPEYPTITMDPSHMAVHTGDEDGWLGLLESAGCFEQRELRHLQSQWDRRFSRPGSEPPRAWVDAEPGDTEREFARRLSRLSTAADRAFKKPARLEKWNLDRMGIGHYQGASMTVKPPMTQDLWRLYRMHSSSAYGVLQFLPDELVYERTDRLAEAFEACGIDPVESDGWLAVAQYHGKATLLLHADSGEVAGLEPAPARRLRTFSRDLFEFVSEFGIGRRHGELCYDPGSRNQSRDARHWVEFLESNELI